MKTDDQTAEPFTLSHGGSAGAWSFCIATPPENGTTPEAADGARSCDREASAAAKAATGD